MGYFSSCFLLFMVAFVAVKAAKINCPDVNAISPCTCSNDPDFPASETILACRSLGGAVIQNRDVTKLMEFTRAANRPEPVVVYKFILRNTQVSELQMIDFKGYVFGEGGFNIFEHQFIDLKAPNPISNCQFSAWKLSTNSGNMTDAGVLPLLHCAKPASVKLIDFGINDISGEETFWTALAPFTELDTLLLNENSLTTIGGGGFKPFTKLVTLRLQNNQITSLGSGAFEFDQPWDPIVERTPLIIDLGNNDLTQDSIHYENGLPMTSRWTILNLQNNSFTSIPQGFQTFLSRHGLNQLDFKDNPINCDPSLKWLQDARSQLEYRVTNAICKNDSPNTVFTSQLVAVTEPTTTQTTGTSNKPEITTAFVSSTQATTGSFGMSLKSNIYSSALAVASLLVFYKTIFV